MALKGSHDQASGDPGSLSISCSPSPQAFPGEPRIVVPANHSIAPPAGSSDLGFEAKYYRGHDIYSDDHGATWHIGFSDDNPDGYLNVNETSMTQLPDGQLSFNARDHNGTAPGNRTDAYSSDGGTTLDAPYAPQDTITGPVVEGSVLQLPGGPLLFSGPADPNARAAMTVRASHDQGRTWTDPFPISGWPAAYSDLVSLGGDTVGLLYETGRATSSDTLTCRGRQRPGSSRRDLCRTDAPGLRSASPARRRRDR